jgi:hypothetical protein
MLQLATDADVHGDIIRGLRRRVPDLDLIRSLDHLAENASDNEILAWAASQGRILISNDRNTLISFAHARLARGEPMNGVIATTTRQSVGAAIDDILMIAQCLSAEEVRQQIVIYLPL